MKSWVCHTHRCQAFRYLYCPAEGVLGIRAPDRNGFAFVAVTSRSLKPGSFQLQATCNVKCSNKIFSHKISEFSRLTPARECCCSTVRTRRPCRKWNTNTSSTHIRIYEFPRPLSTRKRRRWSAKFASPWWTSANTKSTICVAHSVLAGQLTWNQIPLLDFSWSKAVDCGVILISTWRTICVSIY